MNMFAILLAALLSAPPPPSVDTIIERHVEARGGHKKIKSIRTLIYRNGSYREGDFIGSGRAFMAFMRPFFRVVGNPGDPKTTFMEGYDGSSWEWYRNPGINLRTVGAAAGATRRGSDLEGALVDYREKGHRATSCGQTTIDGKQVHCVRLIFPDDFVRDYLIDSDTYLIAAERWEAPIHAMGPAVATETRPSDYRAVGGVLFAFRYEEREITTGRLLNSMQWGAIEANTEIPRSWFSPPLFERTAVQELLEHLYWQRTDPRAVLWTYREFLRIHPGSDLEAGLIFVASQMTKMGSRESALALLGEYVRIHPESTVAASALARVSGR